MKRIIQIIFSLAEDTAEEGGPHTAPEAAAGRTRGTERTRGRNSPPTEAYRDTPVTQSQNLHSLQSLSLYLSCSDGHGTYYIYPSFT